MNVLVTGITGYVGSIVARRLVAEGHRVRGLSRHGGGEVDGVPVLAGDAARGEGLQAALDGVEVVYFLIHSMESTGGGDAFGGRERAAADNVAAAARRAGVRRIVYLGGPEPDGGARSEHLSSRLAVERILLDAVPDSIALRASIVIGARSRSFRFLVRLVERLPVLAIPGWGAHRSAPVDERDVLAMLVAAAGASPGARVLDAAGPDVVTYRALIERIADAMLVARPTVSLGTLTVTPLASRIAAAIAGEDPGLIGPLMESLQTDLLPSTTSAAAALGVRLHTLDAAIEHALGEWERGEPLRAR